MISVIISLFNAEKFISRAIDSLLMQSYKDFEIIIINDGSTDKSAKICNSYKDNRIRFISQENSGVGSARNAGINISKGDLLFFLDADDYILSNTLKVLHEGYKETGAPIIVGSMFRQSSKGEAYRFSSPTGKKMLNNILLDRKGILDCVWNYINTNNCYLVSHCWGRLYSKAFIESKKIRFDEIMRVGEDGVFNIECLFYADKVFIINEPLYCFQIHGGSSAIEATKTPYLRHDLRILQENLQAFFFDSIKNFIFGLTTVTENYANKMPPVVTNYAMLTHKDVLLAKLKSSKQPIIIYGADVVGKVLLDICKGAGIEISGFCDYNPLLEKRWGLPVYHTSQNAIYIISVMSIRNIVDVLQHREWYAGGILLEEINVTQTDSLINDEKYQIESCRIAHKAFREKDYVFLRSLDIMITERCSLKCKDCSNLMQYFEKPRDYDPDKVIKEVDKLLENVDEILEARILGGDAFMHKDWAKIVKHIMKHDKIRRVIIYTNGVIVPFSKDFFTLSHEKVIVMLTDYGKLSKYLDLIVESFEKHGIKYIVTKPDVWIDCATIHKHSRTPEQNNKLFEECVATHLATMVDGKLFRCPFSASTYLLGFDFPSDYVDFVYVYNPVDGFLVSKNALDICDYCTSRILTNTIVPAIQISKPLKYKRKEKKNVLRTNS